MKFLILGGCGFIGTNLSLFLSKLNHEIIIIDNFSNTLSNSRDHLLKQNNIKIINNCVTDINVIINNIKDVDYAINLCSSPCVNNGFIYAEDLTISTIITSEILLQSASHAENIKKVILLSNLHVYGNQIKYRDKYDESYRCDPINPLGSIKLSEELIAKCFSKTYEIPLLIARTSQIFGEFQNIEKNSNFIESTIYNLYNKKELVSMIDLENSEDFIYVQDFCKILYDLILIEQKDLIQIFNISSGTSYKYEEILKKLLSFSILEGAEINVDEIKCLQYQFPSIFHIVGNNEKLLNTIEVKFTDFDESLLNTVKWIKENYIDQKNNSSTNE